MSEDTPEEKYMPTPADQALYAQLLTGQVTGAIIQAYINGQITDKETYNNLFKLARQADLAVMKVYDMLEKEGEDK